MVVFFIGFCFVLCLLVLQGFFFLWNVFRLFGLCLSFFLFFVFVVVLSGIFVCFCFGFVLLLLLFVCFGDVNQFLIIYHLVGLVVRRPPQEWKVPGANPACTDIFSGSSHTSDLNIGNPVATLPGAWCYRVSVGTGQPGVSIL